MREHILLHVCCGPCAIMPIMRLRERGHLTTALFVNPNIHPLSEYLRRRDALIACAEKLNFDILWRDDVWDIQAWLAAVAGKKDSGQARCDYCYASRLDICAQQLQLLQQNKASFTAFSSSLLYSRYQNHESIKLAGNHAAQKHNVRFYYEDYRDDWQKGIELSKEFQLYRQAYCGCIYSEAERYAKKLQKLTQTSKESI